MTDFLLHTKGHAKYTGKYYIALDVGNRFSTGEAHLPRGVSKEPWAIGEIIGFTVVDNN